MPGGQSRFSCSYLRESGVAQAVEIGASAREVAADDVAWHVGSPLYLLRDQSSQTTVDGSKAVRQASKLFS